jgi:radical SAM/Cys-rich protein
MTGFEERVLGAYPELPRAREIRTLQVNTGYRCNMSCKHCHIDAGPARTEAMDGATIETLIGVLRDSATGVLDLTGGAPELNPPFRYLVREARKLDKHVIVRSNLTIFFEEGMHDLPEFYREHGVEVIASMPHYAEGNVDRVRGGGTFRKSIDALRRLNSLGYGEKDGLLLHLVYNPPGAFLPPLQKELEEQYRRELHSSWGIFFNRLYVFTNMPIGRFREFLIRKDIFEQYMTKLRAAFNASTLEGIMCRYLISVGWDGRLYDCDFNQILGITLSKNYPSRLADFDHEVLAGREIVFGDHCFACTAGQGST